MCRDFRHMHATLVVLEVLFRRRTATEYPRSTVSVVHTVHSSGLLYVMRDADDGAPLNCTVILNPRGAAGLPQITTQHELRTNESEQPKKNHTHGF